MQIERTERRSHCTACGSRLSSKSPTGRILWQSSHVDDKGMRCAPCQSRSKSNKARKTGRQ